MNEPTEEEMDSYLRHNLLVVHILKSIVNQPTPQEAMVILESVVSGVVCYMERGSLTKLTAEQIADMLHERVQVRIAEIRSDLNSARKTQ